MHICIAGGVFDKPPRQIGGRAMQVRCSGLFVRNVAATKERKPWAQTAGYLRDLDGVIVELATSSPRD
jgi:hypothetical protein